MQIFRRFRFPGLFRKPPLEKLKGCFQFSSKGGVTFESIKTPRVPKRPSQEQKKVAEKSAPSVNKQGDSPSSQDLVRIYETKQAYLVKSLTYMDAFSEAKKMQSLKNSLTNLMKAYLAQKSLKVRVKAIDALDLQFIENENVIIKEECKTTAEEMPAIYTFLHCCSTLSNLTLLESQLHPPLCMNEIEECWKKLTELAAREIPDILKAYVGYLKSIEMSPPQEKVEQFLFASLLKYYNSLHQRKAIDERKAQELKGFCSLLDDLTLVNSISLNDAQMLLETIQFCLMSGYLNASEVSSVIYRALDRIIECYDQWRFPFYCYFVYFVAKNEIFSMNSTLYFRLWNAILRYFEENSSNFQEKHIKSLMYSFGKTCFVSPHLIQFYKKQLGASFENRPFNSTYLINLLSSAAQLRLLSEQQLMAFDKVIERGLQENPLNSPAIKDFVAKMGLIYLRMNYTPKSKFFEIYFRMLPAMLQQQSLKFSVYYLLKSYALFQKSNVAGRRIPPGFNEVLSNPQVQELLKRNLKDFLDAPGKDSAHEDLTSSLDPIVLGVLDGLNLEHTQEKELDFLQVDFYLPKHDLVIEVNGPQHYIKSFKEGQKDKCDFHQFNLTTQFKCDLVEAMGKRLLMIPYKPSVRITPQEDQTETKTLSFDKYFYTTLLNFLQREKQDEKTGTSSKVKEEK